MAGRKLSKHVDLVPYVVATIGLSYLLKGAVRVVPYTEEVRRLPPLFSGPPVFVGDVMLQRQDFAIIAVTVVVMAAPAAVLRLHLDRQGAARHQPEPARGGAGRHPGENRCAWRRGDWPPASPASPACCSSPKLLMTPDMGNVVMLAFAAAIVGGFSSLPGCVVGGIMLGVMQNFVGMFISPQAMAVTPFFVIMLVLVLRPQGLFGELAFKKV